MLPKKYRLTVSLFFNEKSAFRTITTPFASYRIKKINTHSPFKITFVVPKKLSKLSSARNRTKRLLSEALLPLLPHTKPGAWLIVYARKILKTEKPRQIQSIIEKDLYSLGILYES